MPKTLYVATFMLDPEYTIAVSDSAWSSFLDVQYRAASLDALCKKVAKDTGAEFAPCEDTRDPFGWKQHGYCEGGSMEPGTFYHVQSATGTAIDELPFT